MRVDNNQIFGDEPINDVWELKQPKSDYKRFRMPQTISYRVSLLHLEFHTADHKCVWPYQKSSIRSSSFGFYYQERVISEWL